jgi:deferrochelatase/peroxidase EfeB
LKYHRPTDSSEGARIVVNTSRRNFLRGALSGAAGTALAGGVLIGGAKADAAAATAATGAGGQVTQPSYPFHGARQAGILTPDPAARQPFTCVAAFDSTAAARRG